MSNEKDIYSAMKLTDTPHHHLDDNQKKIMSEIMYDTPALAVQDVNFVEASNLELYNIESDENESQLELPDAMEKMYLCEDNEDVDFSNVKPPNNCVMSVSPISKFKNWQLDESPVKTLTLEFVNANEINKETQELLEFLEVDENVISTSFLYDDMDSI